MEKHVKDYRQKKDKEDVTVVAMARQIVAESAAMLAERDQRLESMRRIAGSQEAKSKKMRAKMIKVKAAAATIAKESKKLFQEVLVLQEADKEVWEWKEVQERNLIENVSCLQQFLGDQARKHEEELCSAKEEISKYLGLNQEYEQDFKIIHEKHAREMRDVLDREERSKIGQRHALQRLLGEVELVQETMEITHKDQALLLKEQVQTIQHQKEEIETLKRDKEQILLEGRQELADKDLQIEMLTAQIQRILDSKNQGSMSIRIV
eukprot:CAMPEP_0184328866 /NCGR_PEP_ID=MMETSP1049-20130417/143848_1 /TAXON_ID=77928 /ORGANISM="Proteomonas sulcata, Strain CCMP704" /LENGTH=264 /DNA_ID=CAMNT_0026651201 /DNA_START=449 /DNA_END=1243 /DNA_ORIENTATION=-